MQGRAKTAPRQLALPSHYASYRPNVSGNSKTSYIMTLAIFILVGIVFLAMVLYLQSKAFRLKRLNTLLNSPYIRILEAMGFSPITLSSKKAYRGNYGGFYFLVFLDPDDVFFKSSFSIVFVISYEILSDNDFINLNNKYYNRVKSLLFNSESIFFDKTFAQFRYALNPFGIGNIKIEKTIEKISRLAISENLRSIEFQDLEIASARQY